MIVAFDLDGTLANIEHRLHFITYGTKDWSAFFRACIDDEPIPYMMNVQRALVNAGHSVEVWSGRSDSVLTQTREWLDRFGIRYTQLRMRKDGDYRADTIVKAEWFDALPLDQRPTLAFDDRQQVVDMWRSRGVLCCQVAPGDF
jgi:hypothetical protein